MSQKRCQPLNSVPLRVLIADDHPVVCVGVQQIVATSFLPLEFGEAETGQAVLEMVRGAAWDLLVLDVGLPGRSGLEIMPELKRLAPDLRILILTMHAAEQFALRLFKSGVAGYLTKERAPDELIEAIKKILGGGKFVSNALAERMAISLDTSIDRLPDETLTDREFQVMRMMASGMTVAQITKALSLHVRTVGMLPSPLLAQAQLAQHAGDCLLCHSGRFD